jgi:hypothetical protein
VDERLWIDSKVSRLDPNQGDSAFPSHYGI